MTPPAASGTVRLVVFRTSPVQAAEDPVSALAVDGIAGREVGRLDALLPGGRVLEVPAERASEAVRALSARGFGCTRADAPVEALGARKPMTDKEITKPEEPT